LNMPLEIVVCPTVREASGLAVSSRNKYLGEQEREEAVLIYESLRKCREMVESGVDEVKAIIEAMREVLGRSPAIKIEYVDVVEPVFDGFVNKTDYPSNGHVLCW